MDLFMTYFEGSYMKQALDLASQAFVEEEVPVGAVIIETRTGRFLGQGKNSMKKKKNTLLHAEMIALQEALIFLDQERFWEEADIYVTLEPCPMCAAALSFARIRRIYFGAYDPKGGGIVHGPCVLESSSCSYKPEVYGGIYEGEASILLKEFFKNSRKTIM